MRNIRPNPFAVTVKLSSHEKELIDRVAEARQAFKDKNLKLINDRRVSGQNNLLMHKIGLLGELCVARLIDQQIDEASYLSGDKSKDFLLSKQTIEVKTRQGYLVFKDASWFRAQIAVLVTYDKGDLSVGHVQGWITRKEFMEKHFVDDFGYGKNLCMQPAQLFPIHTLTTYCMVRQGVGEMVKEIKREGYSQAGQIEHFTLAAISGQTPERFSAGGD